VATAWVGAHEDAPERAVLELLGQELGRHALRAEAGRPREPRLEAVLLEPVLLVGDQVPFLAHLLEVDLGAGRTARAQGGRTRRIKGNGSERDRLEVGRATTGVHARRPHLGTGGGAEHLGGQIVWARDEARFERVQAVAGARGGDERDAFFAARFLRRRRRRRRTRNVRG
jgi:hypothetical protein